LKPAQAGLVLFTVFKELEIFPGKKTMENSTLPKIVMIMSLGQLVEVRLLKKLVDTKMPNA
jgi:hypothetical protein